MIKLLKGKKHENCKEGGKDIDEVHIMNLREDISPCGNRIHTAHFLNLGLQFLDGKG